MLTKINEVNYDPRLFESYLTHTPIDGMFSIGGGIPRATNWMIVGDPGVGKSTVMMDVIANIKKKDAKVLFISAEMTRVDLYLYVQRYPKFGDIDIFFTGEYEGNNFKKDFEDLLKQGWDVILIDSFVEVQMELKELCGMSSNGAEKYLLNLMYQQNLGKNTLQKYTCFLNIQQVNKGGNFVGSNKLKHMTTGMMEIRFENEEQDERYITFSKNRRGHVGKKMYFTLESTGDVTYDFDRFKKSEKLAKLRKVEKEKMKTEGDKFDIIFGLNNTQGATESNE